MVARSGNDLTVCMQLTVLRGTRVGVVTIPEMAEPLVVDLTDVPAVMRVGYGEGSASAFSAVSADGLDLSEAGDFHHLSRVGVAIDLAAQSVAPMIVPQAGVITSRMVIVSLS